MHTNVSHISSAIRIRRRLEQRSRRKKPTNNWLQSSCSLFGHNFRIFFFFYLKLFELYVHIQHSVFFYNSLYVCFFSALSQVSQSTSINGTDSLEVKVSMVYFLFARWIKRIYANFPKVKCYIFENWRIKLMKIDSDVFHFVCNVQQNDMEKRDAEREIYRKKNNTFLNIILIHFLFCFVFLLMTAVPFSHLWHRQIEILPYISKCQHN